MYREHCIRKGNNYFKDLRAIKNVPLNKMIIVDNLVMSFAAQMDNGIYIPAYTGQETDHELKTVGKFLADIVEVDDVRPYVKRFAGVVELYEKFCKEGGRSAKK